MNQNTNKPAADQNAGIADYSIVCLDCKNDFLFTARDQEFYASQNPPYAPPRRCKPCREAKKAQRENGGGYNARGGYSTPSAPSAPEPPRNAYPDRNVRGERRDEGGGGRADRKPSKRKRYDEFED